MTNTFNFKRFVETLIISMQNVYILIVLKNSHQICKGHMPSQIKCEEARYLCVYCGESSTLARECISGSVEDAHIGR